MSITPKRWNEFQHYKDRAPAWIKLHRKLLDDFAFSRLPLASKALAPLLWLLAAEYEGGKITATNEEIAFRLRISDDELNAALKPLIVAEFFIDDSKALADCKQDAIPEKEREIEKQEETEKESCRVADATPTPSRKRKTYSEEFEGFWSSYPRTPVMSKTEAWKAWEKLSPEDRVNSAEAVPRFVEWLRGKPDHPAVHACRFLSQRRFEGFTTGPPADADLALLEQHRKACMERTNGNAEPEIRGTPGVGEDGSDLAGELRSSDGVVWRDNQEMGR